RVPARSTTTAFVGKKRALPRFADFQCLSRRLSGDDVSFAWLGRSRRNIPRASWDCRKKLNGVNGRGHGGDGTCRRRNRAGTRVANDIAGNGGDELAFSPIARRSLGREGCVYLIRSSVAAAACRNCSRCF